MELLICDDGSTDETVKYFREQTFDFSISLQSLQKKSGPARARNIGLNQARGEIILFLDSDCEVRPDLLEKHMACYADEKIIAVRGESLTPPGIKTSKWLRYLDSNLRGPRQAYATQGTTAISFDKVNTNNFSIRSSVLEPGLKFDENIVFYGGEDMVFAYQLSKLNPGSIVYQPEAETYHQQNSLKNVLRKLEEYGEKTIPYLLKTYPEIYPQLVISRFFQEDGKHEKRVWSKVIFNPFAYKLLFTIKGWMPDTVSFRIYQYLMAWHVLKGYRNSMET